MTEVKGASGFAVFQETAATKCLMFRIQLHCQTNNIIKQIIHTQPHIPECSLEERCFACLPLRYYAIIQQPICLKCSRVILTLAFIQDWLCAQPWAELYNHYYSYHVDLSTGAASFLTCFSWTRGNKFSVTWFHSGKRHFMAVRDLGNVQWVNEWTDDKKNL